MNYGSQWHRWDLHLHTPYTQKNDNFAKGANEKERWSLFYQGIRDYVGDGKDPTKAVCAIAITDYLSVENYFKVRADFEADLKREPDDKHFPDCVKLILPNVELRMGPVGNKSAINIHCIFSPELDEDYLNSRFFSKLQFQYHDRTYSATPDELARFGRAYLQIQENYTEDDLKKVSPKDARKTGINQYVLDSYQILKKVFEEEPELREKTIIAVSNSSNDGVSALSPRNSPAYALTENTGSLDSKRTEIYRFADMIFSSNPKDREYFLGKAQGHPPSEIIKKYRSLKPCVHGCDAHEDKKIFSFPGASASPFCWIKADLTFEGLKQVLYEPEERVRIGPFLPDSKPDYYVIDRVQIDDLPYFSPEPIAFSDKLTCIIGGRSTGKSTLLHNLALSIDSEQVGDIETDTHIITNVRPIKGFHVFWRDGKTEKATDKKIVYIPQTYLNRLGDEYMEKSRQPPTVQRKEETTGIDRIIQDIVLQDDTRKQAYDNLQNKISAQKQTIQANILAFVQCYYTINRIRERQKEYVGKAALEQEIGRLQVALDRLEKQNPHLLQDVSAYQKAHKQYDAFRGDLKALTNSMEFFGNLTSVVTLRDDVKSRISGLGVSVRRPSIDDPIDEPFVEWVGNYEQAMSQTLKRVQFLADEEWRKLQARIMGKAKATLKALEESVEELKEKLKTLRPSVESNQEIVMLSDALQSEREKLQVWTMLEEQRKDLGKQYEQLKEQMSNTFENFRKLYEEYVTAIHKSLENADMDGSLRFQAHCVFRNGGFKAKLEEVFDNRTARSVETLGYDATPEEVKKFTGKLIDGIMSRAFPLKKSYTLESGLRELLTDWNNIHYNAQMDGDNIQDMSPGKKSLVLLRLILEMADSKWPVLIDQPEDDLDNRSIYDELSKAIRQKKIQRQIIVVTHNANIVLNGDAELVIVANRDGVGTPNSHQNPQTYRFEYRGGAIEEKAAKGEAKNAGVLYSKGIQEHICEILEGGKEAFEMRQHKYFALTV